MIALYPMLVSNTVSRNIIPGIAKVLENYIMVYGITGIMERARSGVKGSPNYSFKNKKLIQRESEDPMTDYFYREVIFEQSGIGGATNAGNKGKTKPKSGSFTYVSGPNDDEQEKYDDAEKMSRAKERGKLRGQGDVDKARDASVAIGAFEMKAISLEPTWMKTDIIAKDGSKTSGIIGVKVVPYPVKSDSKLAHLLMYDKQANALQALAITFGRKVENFFYKAWSIAWKIGTLGIGGRSGGLGVTGDPKQDILARRTILKAKDASDIFVLVNQADLSDDFYSSASGILNLFRMGWSSIIIADDVNRRVSFCMRELKGLCSMMPYSMLYQTYSQAKVYEDLEDAKRSASSIFKVKRKSFAKIVGESAAQYKIEQFGIQNLPLFESELITEIEYIDENIGAFVKSLTPANIKATLIRILKGNVSNIPTVEPEKLLKMGSNKNSEFRTSYLLAKRVLENSSPEIRNNKIIELAAIGIASSAVVQVSKGIASDIIVSTKEGLKNFIKNYRQNRDIAKANKTDMPDEHMAEATFGWIAILGSLTVAFFAYTKLLMPLIKLLPTFLTNLVTDYIPRLSKFLKDSLPSDEAVKGVANWDITTATPAEIGVFVVIALLAAATLQQIIFRNRR